MNAILDLKCMSQVVWHDDHSSLAIVNKLGQPHATLLTIMNFPSLHDFCDDDFDIIWDSRYYCWVEPNVDECAIGFHSHITQVFGLLEVINIKSLVKSWTLFFSHGLYSLRLTKQC